MARKSNVEKALEEILEELKPVSFKTKEEASSAVQAAVNSKVSEYKFDDEKKGELVALIKENKESLNIEPEEVNELENLKAAFAKLACMTGNRSICLEFGMEPWEPTKKDMSKYK